MAVRKNDDVLMTNSTPVSEENNDEKREIQCLFCQKKNNEASFLEYFEDKKKYIKKIRILLKNPSLLPDVSPTAIKLWVNSLYRQVEYYLYTDTIRFLPCFLPATQNSMLDGNDISPNNTSLSSSLPFVFCRLADIERAISPILIVLNKLKRTAIELSTQLKNENQRYDLLLNDKEKVSYYLTLITTFWDYIEIKGDFFNALSFMRLIAKLYPVKEINHYAMKELEYLVDYDLYKSLVTGGSKPYNLNEKKQKRPSYRNIINKNNDLYRQIETFISQNESYKHKLMVVTENQLLFAIKIAWIDSCVNVATFIKKNDNSEPSENDYVLLEIFTINWMEAFEIIKSIKASFQHHQIALTQEELAQLSATYVAFDAWKYLLKWRKLLPEKPVEILLEKNINFGNNEIINDFISRFPISFEFLKTFSHYLLHELELAFNISRSPFNLTFINTMLSWDRCYICGNPLDNAHLQIFIKNTEDRFDLIELPAKKPRNFSILVKIINIIQKKQNTNRKKRVAKKKHTTKLKILIADKTASAFLLIDEKRKDSLVAGTTVNITKCNLLYTENTLYITLTDKSSIIQQTWNYPHINLKLNISILK